MLTKSSFPPHCYYCPFKPISVDNYERHVVTKHALLPGYPSTGSLELLKIEPQGMSWERVLSDEETIERLRMYTPVSERIKHYRKTQKDHEQHPTKKMWK